MGPRFPGPSPVLGWGEPLCLQNRRRDPRLAARAPSPAEQPVSAPLPGPLPTHLLRSLSGCQPPFLPAPGGPRALRAPWPGAVSLPGAAGTVVTSSEWAGGTGLERRPRAAL